jgi:hypothetical protein
MAGNLEIKVRCEKLAYVYGGDAGGVALGGLDVVADGAIQVRVLSCCSSRDCASTSLSRYMSPD